MALLFLNKVPGNRNAYEESLQKLGLGKICGIYKITSPSGKIYIGQALNIRQRWGSHKSDFLKSKSKLHSSFVKYGFTNHIFQLVEICPDQELNDKEKHYINFYNTFETEHGLNLTDGGGSYKIAEQTKNKIKELHKGDNYGMKGKKHKQESKDKQSVSKLAEKNPMYRKKQPRELVERRAKASKEKRKKTKHTQETKDKISQTLKLKCIQSPKKGKPLSRETVEKIVQTRRRNGSYRSYITEETRNKQNKTRIRKKLTKINIQYTEDDIESMFSINKIVGIFTKHLNKAA